MRALASFVLAQRLTVKRERTKDIPARVAAFRGRRPRHLSLRNSRALKAHFAWLCHEPMTPAMVIDYLANMFHNLRGLNERVHKFHRLRPYFLSRLLETDRWCERKCRIAGHLWQPDEEEPGYWICSRCRTGIKGRTAPSPYAGLSLRVCSIEQFLAGPSLLHASVRVLGEQASIDDICKFFNDWHDKHGSFADEHSTL